MTRIGIFLCTCDRQIDRSVDVAAVAEALRARTSAATMVCLDHACGPDGRQALQAAMRAAEIERAVIAACPARLLPAALRRSSEAAGLAAGDLTIVDWREGCAWAHGGASREAVTAQAADLVAMGFARAVEGLAAGRAHAPAREHTGLPVAPRVVVVGAGVAGRSAADALARRGCAVTLVERAAAAPAVEPPVDLRAGSRVVGVCGAPGDYRVTIEETQSGAVADVQAGAIIVATGVQERTPTGLYRHDGRRVVTLGEFAARLDAGEPPGGAIVYLLCAGARNAPGDDCSGSCCLDALAQALRVRRADPAAPVTVLFRDLYPPGPALEEIVHEAQAAGITFARYAPERPPRVEEECVEVDDRLGGTRRRLAYDRLALAAPLAPHADAGRLAGLLNLPRDAHGFFVDAHPRVRSERQVERGLFVCGSAHRPVDAETARLQGQIAAARAARCVQAGAVARPDWAARVNPDLCTGCTQCAAACAFGAITLQPWVAGAADRPAAPERIAHVDPFVCLACGSCAVACPSKAIDLPDANDRQIFAQIDASLSAGGNGARRVLVFGCTWSGFAAMELAGARRRSYPAEVRTIELPCSARLDPLHVLYALLNGADGVLLALCPPGECHFAHGNRQAEQRVERLRAQLAAHGLDPRRLAVAGVPADDAQAWVQAVGALCNGV
jgi:heterodisulfide reductase subunit A